MIRLAGMLGAVLSVVAILVMMFPGLFDDGKLSTNEVARLAASAVAGALLAIAGSRRHGSYPWWKHQGDGKQGWVDVAKHAIDADREKKSEAVR